MSWSCAAIDHGITFYQNGKITPCCFIDHSYGKNIKEIGNDPFSDLRTGIAPSVCSKCTSVESFGGDSYRKSFNRIKTNARGYQFIDIRNSNLCNIKCRTCCPENSSQWASEMGHEISIKHQDILEYKDYILSQSVHTIYYTGGEPFINSEHWNLLEELIELGYSKNVSLQYNTNLTTLKYKNKDMIELWKKFKHVSIMASIDAIGDKFNYIRSGADWQVVVNNFEKLKGYQSISNNINVTIATTVSILNIWFIAELLDYFKGFKVTLTDLYFPDYLRLSAIPDSLKDLALKCVDDIDKIYADKSKIKYIRSQINNNVDQEFFKDTLLNVLLLDNIRNEKLFDLLPFKQEAINQVQKNI
jgi:molybdenum cofactor biosynthesis enzyme MoaA